MSSWLLYDESSKKFSPYTWQKMDRPSTACDLIHRVVRSTTSTTLRSISLQAVRVGTTNLLSPSSSLTKMCKSLTAV